MDKVHAIKCLHQSGLSERKIALQLGISRTAVRRHLSLLSAKDTKAPTGDALTGSSDSKDTRALTGITSPETPAKPPRNSPSACAPFQAFIVEKLAHGFSAQRIYQDLVDEHGFNAKYHSVRRYVAKLSQSTEPPFRRIECEQGAAMQVDFGTGARCQDQSGTWRKTHVFRAVLSHSRKGYSEAVRELTIERFIQVLENAFWRLCGVPRVVIFDNGSCAVKHADWFDAELHPKIIEFCKHYGFALVPTRPRTPRHKGKVERGIGYVKDNALKGKSFASLAEQNAHLEQWETAVADTRIHGTTKKHVRKVFEEVEATALLPLPKERFPFYHEGRRKVSRDGHIAVKQAFYSVPPEYLGCTVWVHWNSRILRIFNERMDCIATHCTKEKGRFSTLSEHIVPEKIHGIERGLECHLRKVRFLGVSAARWAELLIQERGVQAARSLQGLLSLSQKYPSDEMNQACEIAWRSKATNYRVIRRLLENRAAASQLTMDFIEEHPMIRPVSEYGTFVRQALHGGSH